MKKIFSIMSLSFLMNANAIANNLSTNKNQNIIYQSTNGKEKIFFYCTFKMGSVIIKK